MSANLSGTTVLHYRILRPIGSGGMGVVYEAEDSRLGRRVALKFLPPQLAQDAPALERFRREARAASALNHPNICTIYAIEEADGARFIAMELLEGQSLDRLIAERPPAWDTLVDIGIQVADALGAAHQRGIIHRDIKPANILITTDGRAKVLDFGVAKLSAAHPGHAETVAVSAAEAALTSAGTAVGTIAYMAPEQARGDEVDARSDIFSFAAVLYEMSTGRRAFDGKTAAVIFQKILDATPDPPRGINPTLPHRLEDVILRGLEKDRDLRYQTAADMRADLKRLKRDASSGRLAFVAAAPGSGAAPSASSGAVLAAEVRRHKKKVGLAAVLMLGVLAAAAYGIYTLGRARDGRAPEVVALNPNMSVTRLTTSGDVRGCGSISPDGKYVAYCDFSGRLKVQQVATGSVVALGNISGATTFSPDSDLVYVSTESDQHPDGVLWAIPVLGGDPRRIVGSNLTDPVGVSPDGRRVAFLREDAKKREVAIVLADAVGGNERQLAVSREADGHLFIAAGVAWSPDGRLLSTTQATIAGGFRMRPVVVDAESGKVTTLGASTWLETGRTVWLPGNGGILFTARDRTQGAFQFWIVRYPDGKATRVTNDARGFGDVSVSVTADGSTIATVPWDIVSNLWSTNADATAPLQQWTSGVRVDGDSGITMSTGGQVYYSSTDGSDVGIWSIDAPGARPRQLTRAYAEVPSAPADGRFIAFQAIHQERYRIWRMQPDGSDARVLSRGDDDVGPVVSLDGRWIFYQARESKGGIVRMPADGGESSTFGTILGRAVGTSPDGRLLLIDNADPSIDASHIVVNVEHATEVARLRLPSGAHANFGRSSDVVAYLLEQNGVHNLWEQPISGGPPRQLTRFASGRMFSFSYSRDGKRLFLARGTRTGDVVLIRNFH